MHFENNDEVFNLYFAKQCSLLWNDGKLSSTLHLFIPLILYWPLPRNGLFTVNQKLDLNKAHSLNMISIRIIKLWGNSTSRPLELILNECISNGVFPSEWKKEEVMRIHKRNEKKVWKSTTLSRCYQFVAKFWSVWYLMK